MRSLSFILLFLSFPAWGHSAHSGDGIARLTPFTADTSYPALKQDILAIKAGIRARPITEDSLSLLFTNLIVNRIIPHWLGTPWSFEGHTAIPRQGTIACGYFVSTTLLHMGFNLNRYKFAQQLPVNEAKTLGMGKPLLEIYNPSKAERIQQLQTRMKEGIYFIGFDQSHVGYLLKAGDDLYVIHSNYINAEGVVRERVETSAVFVYYTRLYVIPISTNQELMRRWVSGESIAVVME